VIGGKIEDVPLRPEVRRGEATTRTRRRLNARSATAINMALPGEFFQREGMNALNLQALQPGEVEALVREKNLRHD